MTLGNVTHHHTFYHLSLLWTDLYGFPIRLHINFSGKVHGRRLYNDSETCFIPISYFNGQKFIVYNGFKGNGDHFIFLLKRKNELKV